MARTIETLRKSEARIITYLITAVPPLRHGKEIAACLNIDYTYVMKICEQMFNKGWLTIHKYKQISYFNITIRAPMAEVKKKLVEPQTILKTTWIQRYHDN